MEYTSDERICNLECGSKCCKSTPPALTSEDLNRIQTKINHQNWFQFISEKSRIRVIGKKENLIDCHFLTEDGLCQIYDYRPLDCELFPLFAKIKQEGEREFRIRWYVWYCPLTEKKGVEELHKKAGYIIHDYLNSKPEIIFEYQKAMLESGAYKKKHFLKEELLTIKSND